MGQTAFFDTPGPAAIPAPRARLLIVEDEAIVAMDMRQQLEDRGYDVCGIADSAADALQMTQQLAPDLVLMDVVIKGPMDGVQTAAALGAHHPTPVIFLTAFNDLATVRRAAATGPYGYVTKPFQIFELRAAIEVALHRYRMERLLKESALWFAFTLRCVTDGVVALDCEQRVRFMNPAAERALGLPMHAALGRHVDEVMMFDDDTVQGLSAISGADQACLAGESVATFGRSVMAADGRKLRVDESVALSADGGSVRGVVITIHGAPAAAPAEAAARLSDERFQAAFDDAAVGMAVIATDGQFLQTNSSLCRLLRCTPAHLATLNQRDIGVDEDAALVGLMERELLQDAVPFLQYERRYRACDGFVFSARVSVSLLHSTDRPSCCLHQIHDLTAQHVQRTQAREPAALAVR